MLGHRIYVSFVLRLKVKKNAQMQLFVTKYDLKKSCDIS